jgi:hypothetical protein
LFLSSDLAWVTDAAAVGVVSPFQKKCCSTHGIHGWPGECAFEVRFPLPRFSVNIWDIKMWAI